MKTADAVSKLLSDLSHIKNGKVPKNGYNVAFYVKNGLAELRTVKITFTGDKVKKMFLTEKGKTFLNVNPITAVEMAKND